MMEAIFAVTPSETIKCVSWLFLRFSLTSLSRTKLIDDSHRPNPQYRGLIHGTTSIIRQEGILGIYRGLFPVVRHQLHLPCRMLTLVIDDEARSKLRSAVYDVQYSQAIRSGYGPTRTTITERDNIRHWWGCWLSDRLHDDALGVCHTFSWHFISLIIFPV